MFQTLERTIELTKMSWAVLKKDRELVLFPVMSTVALVILAGLVLGLEAGIGITERLAESDASAVYVLLLALIYFALAFVVVYFNAALVGAAMIRLAGGNPTVGDGLRMANKRLPQILGWVLISATIGLILYVLRSQSRDNIVGQIVLSLVGGVWAYLTYFVVPILVAEGRGPIAAIRSSGSLFKRTWGEQVSSNIGFGLVAGLASAVGVCIALMVVSISVPLGIAVGVVTVGGALAIISTLEGIFKAALYGYVADGRVPDEFTQDSLAGAYKYGGGGARPYRPF